MNRGVFIFGCNRLALVWFRHLISFLSAFSFKLVDVAFRCSKSFKNWHFDSFSPSPRSHITDIASQSNANLNSTCTNAGVDLLLLSSPLHSPSIHTVLRGGHGDAVGGREEVHSQVRRSGRETRERRHILQR